uniref:Interleukin 9 n=1 Tax=Meleagris gallopavo TaxID=9103 RepID=A0A803YE29_MELGA
MNASMLSYVLLSCVLLSVQAHNCQVSEIIRNTRNLLNKTQESWSCRETAATPCSCLPIPEPGHELACFVEGTKHMMEHNMTSNKKLFLLNQSFQIQLDRNLCEIKCGNIYRAWVTSAPEAVCLSLPACEAAGVL